MILGCGHQGKISSKRLCFPGCACLDTAMPVHTIFNIFLYTLGPGTADRACSRAGGRLKVAAVSPVLLSGAGELVLRTFNL